MRRCTLLIFSFLFAFYMIFTIIYCWMIFFFLLSKTHGCFVPVRDLSGYAVQALNISFNAFPLLVWHLTICALHFSASVTAQCTIL